MEGGYTDMAVSFLARDLRDTIHGIHGTRSVAGTNLVVETKMSVFFNAYSVMNEEREHRQF